MELFEIKDGRSEFYQWDIDRQLVVKDDSITQVHFCNHTDECSLVCEVYEKDGEYLVNVPNILLQESWIIKVYGYDKNYTRYCKNFKVVERTKPYDYVYTETEVLTYDTLNNRIDELEAKGVSPEKLEQALDTYFESNPITHPDVSAFQTEEQVNALIEAKLPASGEEVSY